VPVILILLCLQVARCACIYDIILFAGSKVRLVTLELSIMLLKTLVYKTGEQCYLQDGHLASIEGVREEATLQMRNFYKIWEKVRYMKKI